MEPATAPPKSPADSPTAADAHQRRRAAPPRLERQALGLQQGIAVAETPLILLSDADIEHAPQHVATLVAKLQAGKSSNGQRNGGAELPSLAERALVPAFVFFFAMLYPFALVNDAAAGWRPRPVERCSFVPRRWPGSGAWPRCGARSSTT